MGFFRLGWRLRVYGAERVPKSEAMIVVANHVSYFDPPLLGAAMPRPVAYLAKRELFSIPVLGPTIRTLGAFPIDRSRGDLGAFRRALGALEAGLALGIFPEGTRNREGRVRPQLGSAMLAFRTGVPVVPAYLAGTRDLRRSRQVAVAFGEPFAFGNKQKATREELSKATDEIMRRIYALGETLGDH
ncbi:MAG: lysophospholipid acyltransferase family protein [Vulcanimicrobiaceae bacterium]